MGAWSHEPFGNDDACDWGYSLTEQRGLSPVESAIDAVLETAGLLEADTACRGIAAAEILAKLLGRGTQSDAYTEDIDEWIRTAASRPDGAILEKARRAIDRILGEDSELNDLWTEGEEAEVWRASVLQLQDRLNA